MDANTMQRAFFKCFLKKVVWLQREHCLQHPLLSDSFTILWECGCLDLTVEAHVLKPEFTGLFTDEEIGVARSRLEKCELSLILGRGSQC